MFGSETPNRSDPSSVEDLFEVLVVRNWFQWWPEPYKFLPSDIAADKITHLNYAFAMIHSSTFKIRHFEDNDVSNWGTGNWEVPCSQQGAGCTKGLYEQATRRIGGHFVHVPLGASNRSKKRSMVWVCMDRINLSLLRSTT